jgi:hypothetical protein
MKSILFFFALLAGITASAKVTVTPLATDYAGKKVTFKVTWDAAPYNNKVWVWVDLCPVAGVSPGTFAQATVSSPVKQSGNGTVTGATARGFFIEYAAAANTGTTVTATLTNATGRFNWCAYGSDYPPNAAINPAGGYILKGTPPFTINDWQTVNANTIGAGTCIHIYSITDLTGRPDGFAALELMIPDASADAPCGAEAVTLTASASGGTTTAMTYTWIIGGGAAQTTTANSYTTGPLPASTTYSLSVKNVNNCESSAVSGFLILSDIPDAPTNGSADARCGPGTVTFSATAPDGCTIDWYSASSAGAVVSGGSGAASFAPSLTATTTYHAEARNTTTGCVSATRLAVTATVNANLAVPTLNTPSSVCEGNYLTFVASGGSGSYEWSGAVEGTGNNKQAGPDAGSYTAQVRSYQDDSDLTCYSAYTSAVRGIIGEGAGVWGRAGSCGCKAPLENCSGSCYEDCEPSSTTPNPCMPRYPAFATGSPGFATYAERYAWCTDEARKARVKYFTVYYSTTDETVCNQCW